MSQPSEERSGRSEPSEPSGRPQRREGRSDQSRGGGGHGGGYRPRGSGERNGPRRGDGGRRDGRSDRWGDRRSGRGEGYSRGGRSGGGYEGRPWRGGEGKRGDGRPERSSRDGGRDGRPGRGGPRGGGGFRRDGRGGERRDRSRKDGTREREQVQRLPIPDDVTGEEVDASVRQQLRSMPKTLAMDVAKNLVMVARLLDEDPERAYAHSRVALRLASRVAAVREAAGFAAYAVEKYGEALAEFRAARRMSGASDLWPIMADCERGLGRPEKALAMARDPEVRKLDKAGKIEMRLVAAGARRDMGQADAAVVTLQTPELNSSSHQPWVARLRYAYADALLAAGRREEAREWFGRALESDHSGATDASDRLAELDGLEFVDALDPEAEERAGDEAHSAG